MVNTCSKSLHFGRKSWGEFEKPTPEVPILGTVYHLDSICGVFQQTLRNVIYPSTLTGTALNNAHPILSNSYGTKLKHDQKT